jgi:hypothetical protein
MRYYVSFLLVHVLNSVKQLQPLIHAARDEKTAYMEHSKTLKNLSCTLHLLTLLTILTYLWNDENYLQVRHDGVVPSAKHYFTLQINCIGPFQNHVAEGR